MSIAISDFIRLHKCRYILPVIMLLSYIRRNSQHHIIFVLIIYFSKLVLTLTMLLGRLEIMPLLVLMMPSVWRRK